MSAVIINKNDAYAACIGALALLKNGSKPENIRVNSELISISYAENKCICGNYYAEAKYSDDGITFLYGDINCNWVADNTDFLKELFKKLSCIFEKESGVTLSLNNFFN